MREFLVQKNERLSVAGAAPNLMPPRSLCAPVSAEADAAAATSSLRAGYAARGYAMLPQLLRADVLAFVSRYYASLAHSTEQQGGFYRDEPSAADREHDSILAKVGEGSSSCCRSIFRK